MPPPIRIQGPEVGQRLRRSLGLASPNFPMELDLLQEVRPVIEVGLEKIGPFFMETATVAGVALEFGGCRWFPPPGVIVYPQFVGMGNGVAGFRILRFISPPPAAINILTNAASAFGVRTDRLGERSSAAIEFGSATLANWAGSDILRGRISASDGGIGPFSATVMDLRGFAIHPGEHLICLDGAANEGLDIWATWAEGPTE